MPCLSCSDNERKEEKYYIWLAVYVVVLLFVFIGHKSALLYVHFEAVLKGLHQKPLSVVDYLDGMPSYLCVLVIVLGLLVGTFVGWKRDIPKQKSFFMITSVIAMVFMCVCTITQISVVIYKDIVLFLDVNAAGEAECYCFRDETRVPDPGPINFTDIDAASLFYCRCNVPHEEYPIAFSVPNTDVIDGIFLKQFLDRDKYTGDSVNTTIVDTAERLFEETDDDFFDMKMLLGIAQLSVLFVILRLPMFVIAKKANVAEKEAKRLSESSGMKRYVLKSIQSVAKSTAETLKVFLGIGVFAFVESLDSFTLLDDIIEHRYTFGSDRALTLATLSLVLLNIIVVNFSGIVAFLGDKPPPDATERRSVEVSAATKAMDITKLVVAVLSNLPFMLLRSYLLYAYEGFKSVQIGSVYVIFITKELVLFILGVTEFSMTSHLGFKGRSNLCRKTVVYPVSTTSVGSLDTNSTDSEKE